MKNTKLLKYVLLLLLFVTVPIHANPDFTELEKIVPEELKDSITPGAVIAIISGDRVIYQKAFGVANVETGAPMQPEMLFRLGSTTKMFTAGRMSTSVEKVLRPAGTGTNRLPNEMDPKLNVSRAYFATSNWSVTVTSKASPDAVATFS